MKLTPKGAREGSISSGSLAAPLPGLTQTNQMGHLLVSYLWFIKPFNSQYSLELQHHMFHLIFTSSTNVQNAGKVDYLIQKYLLG